MSQYCQAACLTPYTNLPQLGCDVGYRAKDRANILILAKCNFEWDSDVAIPGDTNDPPATVTIGPYTDLASWQTAIDSGLITAFCVNTLTPTVDDSTRPGRCGLLVTWKSTSTLAWEVDILPNDRSDFDYFCQIKKDLANGNSKVLGQISCDGSQRLYSADQPSGLQSTGSANYIDATDDAPALWSGNIIYETSGTECLLPINVPGLDAILQG